MGTDIRPTLSRKNKYWLSRHRYYELKHFCLQYDYWKLEYDTLASVTSNAIVLAGRKNGKTDPVLKYLALRIEIDSKIKMVEKCAKEADIFLYKYIFTAVTKGLSYDCLHTKYNIPCSKDMYYDRYRKFFWLLDKERD